MNANTPPISSVVLSQAGLKLHPSSLFDPALRKLESSLSNRHGYSVSATRSLPSTGAIEFVRFDFGWYEFHVTIGG
jgi:hypothetical protein